MESPLTERQVINQASIGLLMGYAILDLHKRGKSISQPAIVNALRQRQEQEVDEILRANLRVAIDLLSL